MQVLDVKGEELKAGDSVERFFITGKRGGLVGRMDEIRASGVRVTWNRRTGLGSIFDLRRSLLDVLRFRPTYRCPDLTRISDNQQIGEQDR